MINKSVMPDDTSVTIDTNTAITATRQQQLTDWLQQAFENQEFTLNSLPGDASARQYHRIQLLDAKGATTARYIVMDSADEQEAMQQFVNVTKLMAPTINVPKLIAQDVEQGFLVLQDFGVIEFADLLVKATPAQVNNYYQSAMQTLIALQSIPIETAKAQYQLPDYDAEILGREMDLFDEWFAPFIGVSLDKALWEALKAALIKSILAQPQLLVHRDYHSRNLMQDLTDSDSGVQSTQQTNSQANKKRLGVIDFQDAIIGAYSYDLVSLLRDAYVEWSEQQVSAWISDFWQMQQQSGIATAVSLERFEYDVNVMGVQRHLKVLGIFIRLFERDGKNRYLANIPTVMRDLCFEIEWLAAHGDEDLQQALLPFNDWLMDTALPAYQRQFVQQYI